MVEDRAYCAADYRKTVGAVLLQRSEWNEHADECVPL